MKVLKKIWNDPVWSKVISAGIISIGTIIYTLIISKLDKLPFWDTLLMTLLTPYLLIFVFLVLSIIWIVNYFNHDSTAMGKHPNSIDKEFPNIPLKKEIEGIVSSLSDGLRSIDIQTNWSSQYFTPLDAEVEIIKGTNRKKKIMDLLSAIKKSEDRLFLVLGDPGSGKSVSLRKLCQDLSKETKKTGKIPIYLNLKEWQLDKNWDQNNPPTTKDLMQFVLSNIERSDVFISKFFNRKIDDQSYFERLYLTGHLYFVFDSFDEIPSVLNEDENSWLIKELSKVIFTFLKGARENSSQGILSSRLFRKPTREFQCTTTLEIRPFSENKIVKTFERNGKIDNSIIKDFFKNRSHLVPIARNPFTSTLISEYIDFNNGALPKNHAELFDNYLNQLLDNCKDQLKKKNISKEQVISFAMDTATSMYNSNQGWEIEIQALRDNIPNADKCIDILKFARIGRGNIGDEGIFSFAHRRFAEYFMAKNMLDNKMAIDLQAIPKDSQLRDALVLYCEIADDETASKIADFCWEIITTTKNLQNIEVIHALRFLRDAFKGRKECLRNFNTQLAKYMRQQISKKNNMLSVKIIVECVSLLDDDNINENILEALYLDNYWISETAFYSCRNIPILSKDIMLIFQEFFSKTIPIIDLLQSYSDYKFSLSLSESFSHLLLLIKFRIFDFLTFLLTFICFLILLPGIFLTTNTDLTLDRVIAYLIFFLLSFYLTITPPSSNKIFKYRNPRFYRNGISTNMVSMRIYELFIRIGSLSTLFLILFQATKEYNLIFKLLIFLLLLCPLIDPLKISWKKFSVKKVMNILSDSGTWKEIGIFIIFIVIIFIVFFGVIYASTKFVIVKSIVLGALAIGSILMIIFFIKKGLIPLISDLQDYFFQNKMLKKLDVQLFNNREAIYSQFKVFNNDKIKLKFVKLLGLYVHNVSGEWPNNDIFIITSNPANILLAQLEEKWLGINR